MRTTLIAFAAVLTLTFAMTSCENASDTGKAAGNAVKDAAKATGTAVGNAAEATGEYLTETKETAVKAAQDTFNRLDKKWKEFQAKAEPTTEEAKADLQEAKDVMADALADVKAKLAEARDASGDAWQQNVKPALDAALQKAKKLYEDAAAKFRSE